MRALILVLILCGFTLEAHAQRRSPGRSFWGRGYATDPIDYAAGRGRIPPWELDADVPRDCFTFARVKYRSWTQQRSYTWYTDYRDSDLNLSFRLHQLTAMRV